MLNSCKSMNNTSSKLRSQVTPSDRDAVRRIVETTGFFRADEVDVAVELVDEALAKGEASGYHFVFAEVDGIVVGYACYGPIACTLGSYDLYWIAVDPSRQGQGIGQILLLKSSREEAVTSTSRPRAARSTHRREHSTNAAVTRSLLC